MKSSISGLAHFSQQTFRSANSSRFCYPTSKFVPEDFVSIICGAPSSSREERCVFCWTVIYQARRKRHRSLMDSRENQPLPRTLSFISIFPIRETSSFLLLLGIGVDIEQIRSMPDMDDLGQRFFSSEELSQIALMRREQRERAFFDCWTRKQAYLKVIGSGLSTRQLLCDAQPCRAGSAHAYQS
jgi:hypothetical protein